MNPSAQQPYLAAIYARVSTTDQDCSMQLTELREYVARSGWKISEEYIDKGFSGSKSDRPALNRLMRAPTLKPFSAVLVWKLDRFARSVQQFVGNVQKLDLLGIRFLIPSQSI